MNEAPLLATERRSLSYRSSARHPASGAPIAPHTQVLSSNRSINARTASARSRSAAATNSRTSVADGGSPVRSKDILGLVCAGPPVARVVILRSRDGRAQTGQSQSRTTLDREPLRRGRCVAGERPECAAAFGGGFVSPNAVAISSASSQQTNVTFLMKQKNFTARFNSTGRKHSYLNRRPLPSHELSVAVPAKTRQPSVLSGGGEVRAKKMHLA